MNEFYKATPLYKEYQILSLISHNDSITQRNISDSLHIAVSMVNKYLKEYEQSGLLDIHYISDKKVEYLITEKGEDRIRFLNIGFLSSSTQVYEEARRSVLETLERVLSPSTKNIIMYGAGEVAGIILDVLRSELITNIKVLAVIDDDINKQGKFISNIEIIPLDRIREFEYDEILVSSYKQQNQILGKLEGNVDQNRVKRYFPEIL